MKHIIVVAALGLGVGASAGAAQYTLLVHEHSREFAKRTDSGDAGPAGSAEDAPSAAAPHGTAVVRTARARSPSTIDATGAPPAHPLAAVYAER